MKKAYAKERSAVLRRFGFWVLIALLASGTALFSACAGNGAAPADEGTVAKDEPLLNTAKKLVVGHNLNYFPVIVAQEKGFFKEEFGDEVTVETPRFASGPAQNEAVTAGQLDLANMGDLPTVQVWANNVDIKVISYLWDLPKGYSMVAHPDSGIETLADIKGKRIATILGSNHHKLLLKFLASQGLTPDDIQMTNLPIGDAVTSLREGLIDAITVDEPILSQLQSDGFVEVSTAEGYDRIFCVVYGRSAYLEQNPDIVARYLKTINKTNKWIDENPDEAVRIVAEYMGSDDLEGTKKIYQSKNWITGVDQSLIDTLNETIQFSMDEGLITRTDLNAEDLVTDEYVKAAGLQ
ncbi:MAG: ABC transporter substrate-binding protein [Clostridiales Family XIII bacterium]|jgi:sulfonate transport system substrate-binding protein|nr:ABC transporter substrate-binding protein [Clostridiales Family XIII bacterium]